MSLTATALISGIPQLVKAGAGIWQMIQGNKERRDRPEMPVPAGVDQALNIYKGLAGKRGLPGQEIYEGNIRGATATGAEKVMDISQGGEALGAITQMVAGEQDKFADLGAMGAEMAQANQKGLAGMYQNQAQWQQAKWEWDKKMKYDEGQGMFGAGMQNVMGAMQGASSIGTALLNPNSSDTNSGNIEELVAMLAEALNA
jgi:hypothetical protein